MLTLTLAPLFFDTVVGSFLHVRELSTSPAENSRSDIAKRDSAIPTIYLGDLQKFIFNEQVRLTLSKKFKLISYRQDIQTSPRLRKEKSTLLLMASIKLYLRRV